MLKNIETHDRVIIQKMVQLPINVAAEVLTCYCKQADPQCALVEGGEERCPFAGTRCMDITVDMWEEYLNA